MKGRTGKPLYAVAEPGRRFTSALRDVVGGPTGVGQGGLRGRPELSSQAPC